MTDCEKYLDMISLYVDGQLSDDDITELMAHTASCKSCAALLLLYEDMHNENPPEAEPPAELLSGVMDKSNSNQIYIPVKKHFRFKKSIIGLTAAVACALLVLCVYWPGPLNMNSNYSNYAAGFAGNALQLDRTNDCASTETAADGYGCYIEGSADSDCVTSYASCYDTNGSPPETSQEKDFEDYYAVLYIYEELPSVLSEYELIPYKDGTYIIYIPASLADTLCEEGTVTLYNSPFDEAGVSDSSEGVLESGSENAENSSNANTAVVIFNP